MNNDNLNNLNKDTTKIKKSKLTLTIIIAVFIILIISIISIMFIYFLKNDKNEVHRTNETKYNFEYTIEQKNYKAQVTDNKINIEINYICSEEDCTDEKNSVMEIKYSENNYKKLKEFILNTLKIEENSEIEIENLEPHAKDVLMTLHQSEELFEIEYEKYKYKIEYVNDDYSKIFHFYFKEDNILVVKVANYKDNTIESIETSNIKFNKENMEKLFNFAKKKTNNLEKNKYTKYSKFDKEDENIFNALIHNDEDYLTNNIIELLYEIKYTNVKCPSPILKLYNDNTYEYYNTYTIDDSYPTPKIGTYNIDIENMIKDINKNNCTLNDIEITNSINEKINTCLSNKQLSDFLNEYNLKLDICITQQ